MRSHLRGGLAPVAFSLGASAIIATFACGPEASDAAVLRVAVAANFAGTHEGLAQRFSSLSGVAVSTSSGSTGQLYAQIRNGAPYHVFLAADEERPQLLEEEGAAVPGTRFTYALGRLALVGFGADSVRADGRDIAEGRFVHLAVANPDTAPYGAAAMEVLQRLGLDQRVAPESCSGKALPRCTSSCARALRSSGSSHLPSSRTPRPTVTGWCPSVCTHPCDRTRCFWPRAPGTKGLAATFAISADSRLSRCSRRWGTAYLRRQ